MPLARFSIPAPAVNPYHDGGIEDGRLPEARNDGPASPNNRVPRTPQRYFNSTGNSQGQCLPFGGTVKTGIRARGLDKTGKSWHSSLDECGRADPSRRRIRAGSGIPAAAIGPVVG